MILQADYHTHTIFSHGKGSILDNALAAKEKGLKEVAITDHGIGHRAFGVKEKELPLMRKLCDEATALTGVKVLLGIEANVLGVSGATDFPYKSAQYLDVFLAGIHKFIKYDKLAEWFKLLAANSVTKKFKDKPSAALVKRNTEIYLNAIKNNPIDVLVHPNYCIFADIKQVAECCRDYGTYFEIDARKEHLTDEEWKTVIDTGVSFVIDSDAHKKTDVGNISGAKEMLSRLDFPLDRIVNLNGVLPENTRFSEFKKKL